jgi:hypothetical protein
MEYIQGLQKTSSQEPTANIALHMQFTTRQNRLNENIMQHHIIQAFAIITQELIIRLA